MIHLKTIDAHVGGSAVRLVVDGFPVPRGQTMCDKRDWAMEHADHLRRSLLLEPRGHLDMCGAVLTEAATAGAHAGVLFMHNKGFGHLSGTAIIAVTTIALQRGLLMPGGDGKSVVFDSTAGAVRARASFDGDRVERVSVVGVPSFVLLGGVVVKIGGRVVRADIAFGGAFYAIVDSESVGVPVNSAHISQLRAIGQEIVHAIESSLTAVHPLEPRLHGIHGTIFTGPAHGSDADLRVVTVSADRAVARSPSGTGAAAILSVLDAIGLLGDAPFVCEGLIGSRLIARVAGRTMVGDYSALVPELEGSAWITGDHALIVDEADPLREGFRI
jgi:proline racemase